METLWDVLEPFAVIWDALEAFWDAERDALETPWGAQVMLWDALETLWETLGALWDALERSGTFRKRSVALWKRFGALNRYWTLKRSGTAVEASAQGRTGFLERSWLLWKRCRVFRNALVRSGAIADPHFRRVLQGQSLFFKNSSKRLTGPKIGFGVI